jgi:PEP-CTERM motif
MCVRGFRFLPIALSFVAFSPVPPAMVEAELITLRFTVRTDVRCFNFSCEPFLSSFPLTVTFDSEITRVLDPELDPGGGVGYVYGSPQFSPVPLALPAIPPDAVRRAETLQFFNPREDQPPFFIGAIISDEFHGNETSRWITVISDLDEFPSLQDAPALTAESLIALLDSGRPPSFGHVFQNGKPFPENIEFSYGGQAFLNDGAAPIPEPSTILLLSAAGAATLIQRRRRSVR